MKDNKKKKIKIPSLYGFLIQGNDMKPGTVNVYEQIVSRKGEDIQIVSRDGSGRYMNVMLNNGHITKILITNIMFKVDGVNVHYITDEKGHLKLVTSSGSSASRYEREVMGDGDDKGKGKDEDYYIDNDGISDTSDDHGPGIDVEVDDDDLRRKRRHSETEGVDGESKKVKMEYAEDMVRDDLAFNMNSALDRIVFEKQKYDDNVFSKRIENFCRIINLHLSHDAINNHGNILFNIVKKIRQERDDFDFSCYTVAYIFIIINEMGIGYPEALNVKCEVTPNDDPRYITCAALDYKFIQPKYMSMFSLYPYINELLEYLNRSIILPSSTRKDMIDDYITDKINDVYTGLPKFYPLKLMKDKKYHSIIKNRAIEDLTKILNKNNNQSFTQKELLGLMAKRLNRNDDVIKAYNMLLKTYELEMMKILDNDKKLIIKMENTFIGKVNMPESQKLSVEEYEVFVTKKILQDMANKVSRRISDNEEYTIKYFIDIVTRKYKNNISNLMMSEEKNIIFNSSKLSSDTDLIENSYLVGYIQEFISLVNKFSISKAVYTSQSVVKKTDNMEIDKDTDKITAKARKNVKKSIKESVSVIDDPIKKKALQHIYDNFDKYANGLSYKEIIHDLLNEYTSRGDDKKYYQSLKDFSLEASKRIRNEKLGLLEKKFHIKKKKK